MVTCARRGCGADLSPAAAAAASAAPCLFHPGAPVFHEGLKSWSCCKDINKPVMEFDQFMAIAGCTTADAHTTEKQALPAPADTPAQAAAAAASHVTEDGTEVFGSAPAPSEQTPQQPVTQPLTGANLSAAQLAAVAQKKGAKGTPPEEEADPPAADAAGAVPDGTKCKRNGCGHTAQGTSTGARCRADESCSYHPGVPIFHEGSKGWSCCKPKVLDFDDFMKLPTCTASKHGHLYMGAPAEAPPETEAYEKVDARVDHYETPDSVRVSVYAKGAALPPESEVTIAPDAVSLDLWLPPPPGRPNVPRRVLRTLRPFAPVDPAHSSFTIGKFKTDIVLAKATPGVSWPALEAGDGAVGYGLTFGREVDAQHNAAR